MARKKKETKYMKEVYEAILAAGEEGITTKDIVKITGINKHSIKYPRQQLLLLGKIIHKQYLAADMRGAKYMATKHQRKLPISGQQIAVINAFRISRKLRGVDNE